MGYISNVKILCEEKAYQMIKESMEKYNRKNNDNFVPDCIEKKGDLTLLSFYDLKWYHNYEDIKSVEDVLNTLIRDYDEKDGYGFKKIEIGEDNATTLSYNNSNIDDYLDVIVDFNCNW